MKKNAANAHSACTIKDLLRTAGIRFAKLEDVPLKTIREVQRQRHTFPGMRSIELPPATIRQSLQEPILRDILITRVGHCNRLAGHYIPRPEGSLGHIVLYCTRGKGWLEIAGKRWPVNPSTLICIPATVPHSYGAAPLNPWSNYWFHVTGTQAAEYFQHLRTDENAPLIHLTPEPELLSAFEDVWSAMKAAHTHDNLTQASLHFVHFVSLVHRFQHANDLRERTQENAIQRSIQFMHRNIGRNFSLPQLAEIAHMSVSRYTLTFRNKTGASPVEYFNRLKIQHACDQLRSTALPVKAIAESVGFSDPYYFSRVFRRIAGISPLPFRAK